MAKLFNGSINFPSTMTPTGAQPLDDRSVVKSLQDLFSANTFGTAIYNGMMVSVVDEQKVYMLVDDTKATQEEGWVAVGSGNGSVAVETYAEAIALATEKNIGQIIYLTKESEYDADGEEGEGVAVKYDAAPYIVIGAGELMKLAASTASGDINSEVASLKTKVSGLETTIGNAESGLVKKVADLEAIDHDAYIAADNKLKEDLQGEIAGKVAQDAYDTKMGELDAAIAGKVAQDAYDTKMGELDAAIAGKVAQDAYDTKMGELDAAIAGKVAQDDFDAKVVELTAATTKLAGIEENAEVNVIEVVKVNGTALQVAESDRSVDITIPTAPVQGVAEGEKLISLDGDKLKSTLTIAYVAASKDENGEHVPSQLRLQGIGGDVISSINADQFVKDGMIESVVLDGPQGEETGKKYLVITWNTEAGKDVIRLDVSELFNPYTASNGVKLENGNFSLKLATNEQYLTVGTDGLATTEALWNKVIELDNTNLSAATAYTDTAVATAEQNAKDYADEQLVAAKDYADEQLVAAKGYADEQLVAAKGYADEQLVAAKGYADGVADTAEQNAKDYADSKFVTKEGFNEFEAEYEEKLNGIAAGAEVNVIEKVVVNNIEATVENKVATVKVEADDIELGTVIKNGEEIKYSGDTKLSVVLQGIQDSIRGAIAGGVNSVAAGDTVIDVNSADANNPTVSLKVEAKSEETIGAGHIEMVKGNNGLYGVMYYDGDDVE